jgi:hypothetical protein
LFPVSDEVTVENHGVPDAFHPFIGISLRIGISASQRIQIWAAQLRNNFSGKK